MPSGTSRGAIGVLLATPSTLYSRLDMLSSRKNAPWRFWLKGWTRGGASTIDHDMGAKHAKWFVTSAKTTGWLRETELVPKTQGIVTSIKEMKFAMGLARHGKVPPPFPPHVAKDVQGARRLYEIVRDQGRDGAAGIVQGEKGLARIEFAESSADAEDSKRGGE